MQLLVREQGLRPQTASDEFSQGLSEAFPAGIPIRVRALRSDRRHEDQKAPGNVDRAYRATAEIPVHRSAQVTAPPGRQYRTGEEVQD